MGYRDYKLILSEKQALAADAASTYFLDTELTTPGWSKGNPLGIIVTVTTAFTGTTGVNILICHKATSDPTSGDSTLASFTIPIANLVKGAEFILPLPVGVSMLRYVGAYYDLINSDERGTLSAYFTPLHIGIAPT